MSSTWDILGIIYLICLIPAILITIVIKDRINIKSTLFIFGTVWLILPMFPIWYLIKKFQNNE